MSLGTEDRDESTSRPNSDINNNIFALMRSPDVHSQLGGIMAIDKLLDVYQLDNMSVRVTRFSNYLQPVILTGDLEVVRAAVKVMGKLTTYEGLASEIVEYEVTRTLEWLQSDRQESRRHAAILMITALATSSPTLLYSYINQIMSVIWVGLRDPKVIIRVDTAEALGACLELMHDRDNEARTKCCEKIYQEAQAGFRIGTTDAVHGSLLALRELLKNGDMFMQDKYGATCELVLRYKDSKEVLVRRTVLSILPDLAKYNRIEFTKKYLSDSMTHLISQFKKERERALVFLSIGKIGFEVKSNIAYYLDPILNNVKESLKSRGRYRKEQESAIFKCIILLAEAVGQVLSKHITSEVLDLIFACGLSEELNDCLVNLVRLIPPFQNPIEERLLDVISWTLSGAKFQAPGSPNSTHQINTAFAKEYRESMLTRDGLSSEKSEDDLIVLALQILESFHFKGVSLSEFVKDCVLQYIDHSNPRVRKHSALTSSLIYSNDPICHQISANALKSTSYVIEKLLTVAVSDPVSNIRLDVLKSLDKSLDKHLSQSENVRMLFMTLNDEYFPVRQAAIIIIGRLTKINPAYVVPSLRKTLIQLLSELEFASSPRNKEESSKLLGLLISSTYSLVKPYLRPILDILVPRARDPNPAVASSIIAAIGELSRVGGEEMSQFFPELMSLILDTLQDQSSSVKRDAALKTLGQLSSSSGYVIDPLLDYPQLMSNLVSILKSSDQNQNLKRETVRVMGILGALDPFKHREVERKTVVESTELDSAPIDVLLLMQGMSPSSDEYYPTVVITTLMGLLKDPSLVTHHNAIAQAVLHIFKSLGLKCVPFLNQIIPGLLGVIRSSSHVMAEFIFRQLSNLVTVVKQHTRNYLDSIFEVVQEFFMVASLQPVIISLIDAIAQALDGEFKTHIPRLLPLFINVIQNDKSYGREPSLKILNSFVIFGSNIEEYVHLIIPSIVNLFEYTPLKLRTAAIETVGELCRTVNLNDMASRIIHPLIRILNSNSEELRKPTMDTLSALCFSMGTEFTTFIPVINNVLVKNKIHATNYEQLITKLLNNEPLPQNLNPYRKRIKIGEETSPADVTAKKLKVNQHQLKLAWDTSQRSTRDDWLEWMRKLSLELLKESPSHALRASASIAGVYAPLAKELFNPSFYSCWGALQDQYQEDLVKSLETALTSPNIPPETLQTLLNLAEYMEHDEKPLPIDIRTLAQYARKCHAFAKALHYKELEFLQEPKTATIEDLIGINNHLQQSDSAIGILTQAQQHHDLQLKETWYEKLQRWDDALEAYNRREKEEPASMEVTMGKMRCLHALGEWEQLSKLAQERWTNASQEIRRTVAPLAAAAAWGLNQWERMDTYIGVMKQESPDRSFFQAILNIHRGRIEKASEEIVHARDLLATELTALVSESYARAYGVVVRVQMLSELEEIIAYKDQENPLTPEARVTMRKTWMRRLKGCQRNVDIWQRMLKVRALVIKPKEDMDMWIKFANLCRKSGRLGLAEKSLNRLLETDEYESQNGQVEFYPKVLYAQLKYMWAAGSQEHALHLLVEFTNKMLQLLDLKSENIIDQPLPTDRPNVSDAVRENTKILARCFLKQGEWAVLLRDTWKNEDPDSILGSYLLATHFDKTWYKAWHNWALANFEFISLNEGKNQTPEEMESSRLVPHHVVPAIQGFFRSIALSEQKSLQDTLRLLTLWFKYGGLPDPAKALNDGFQIISMEVWLDVIPQLISRIHQPDPTVSKTLHGLLADLGRQHPQALIYPLTVAIKSDSVSRQKAATNIIDKMRTHSAVLVEQAELVSFELIRVSVLWNEQWHEGLEDASRYYFGEHNIEKMFATLEPLHAMLEKGPSTLRETAFITAFGRDLVEAYGWIQNYRKTNDIAHLNQAWDIYYNVFRRISRQLPQPQPMELQNVSPKLLNAKNLQLAVPGTYVPGKPVISIASFDPTFTIISSKQRPRRLCMKGSDGKDYQFALKGHEDIRQDNLVMQLFGLVNTLLADDPECFKRHLNIQPYSATPLSPKSGLLGWVPHSDTFHILIREYREGKILLNIEYRVMLQMAPDYDSLTHLQKIEVFKYALDNTTGQDLYRVLWLKSRTSEAWMDRRTQYTRSLAVMSMVGYILGLGDRHPSNLMLDRYTGKVIHIDFGDCFEAAILREKFPEKVPFRLTRMLTFAMEVSGIEGSFRITCEHVMSLLRDNKESLMAILEAFAYDPLINWGFEIPTKGENALTASSNAGPGGGSAFFENEKAGNADNFLRRPSAVSANFSGNPEGFKSNNSQTQRSSASRDIRAAVVLKRITDKLTGNDFKRQKDLDVPTQVDKLIIEATDVENLCLHYIGWCSFW